MKILIADDEEAVLDLIGEMVESVGYESTLTRTGREAWEAFEREPFRLVITDWLMPGMNGLELTRRIRTASRTRYTYVIMLTALGGTGHYLEGMEAGVDDFVTKPISLDELGARLRVAARILALQDNVKLLEGLLRICMYCKKVHVTSGGAQSRSTGGDWTSVERYVEERSDASFSHDICPACYEARVRPEIEGFIERLPRAEGRGAAPEAG